MTVETLQIFELDADQIWTGARAEVLATDGAPAAWAIAPEPPAIEAGQRLRWFGAWAVVSAADAAAILQRAQAAALVTLGAAREVATQFFIYDGVLTKADAAISVVTGQLEARTRRGVPPEAQARFKLMDGEWRLWDETALEQFGFALGDHIQACFDLENQTSDAIQAATDKAAIDEILAGVEWPT